jgi:neutral ceramidase
VALPLRELRPPLEVEAETEQYRAELGRLRRVGNVEEIRAATARFTQAKQYADMVKQYAGKSSVDWEIQCICLGSVALVSTRGEPFTETARRIVTGSPFPHTLVSGYSNRGFGYIPTRSAFVEGGYEITASPFAPGAAEILANESLRMLEETA